MKVLPFLLLLGGSLFGADLFSPGNAEIQCSGNVRVENTVLEGRAVRRLVLGGVTSQNDGNLRILLKDSARSRKNNAFTLTYKGSGKPGDFVIIIHDTDNRTWCWNGLRWQADAMLSSADDFLQKRVFPFCEFRTSPAKKIPSLSGDRIKDVCISIGRIGGKEERADLVIAGASVEQDPKGESRENFSFSKEKRVGKIIPPVPLAKKEKLSLQKEAYHLPSWISWDISKAHRTDLGTRLEISLNNYWQFQPVISSAVSQVMKKGGKLPVIPDRLPQNGSWNYAIVPGSWDTQNYCTLLDAKHTPVREVGTLTLSEFAQGIFRRTVFVPESWRGKRAILRFASVSDTARLFVNGVKACPDFQNTAEIDITDFLYPGKTNEIALFVQYDNFPFPESHRKHKEIIMRGADWWFGWHSGPGITGDVKLLVRPEKCYAEDLAVFTETQKQKITLSAFASNASEKEMKLSVSGRVLDGKTTVLEIPAHMLTIPAMSRVRADVEKLWPDAVLWSPEEPKLYHAEFILSDSDGKVIDRLRSRFGFRELAIEKGYFTLNNKKYRLKFFGSGLPWQKMSSSAIREAVGQLKSMNYNGMIYSLRDDRVISICDELGFLLAMREVLPSMIRGGAYLPGVNSIGFPTAIYFSSRLSSQRKLFEETIRSVIRSCRNNPSVVIWDINPLLCYTYEWIDPNRIDRERAENDLMTASLREEAFLRDFDPGRLVMHSMAGCFGKIIAANPYPCFSNNIEEWEDWPMLWKKEKPLVAEEIALPYIHNMNNFIRNGRQTPWESLRQLYFEQGARYFGDAHYMEAVFPVDDKVWNLGDGRKEQIPGGTFFPANPAAVRTKQIWLKSCSPAWRFYDMSGIWPFECIEELMQNIQVTQKEEYPDVTLPGPKMEVSLHYPDAGRGEIFRTMREIQKPFLAKLGGRMDHFTDREHHFLTGECVEKTMLFSNDSLKDLSVKAEWHLRASNGGIINSGKWSGTLKCGDIVRKEILFTCPNAGKYTLEFDASSELGNCQDSLSLSAYDPMKKYPFTKKIALYDEVGRTEKLLSGLGVPFTHDFSQTNDVLIVGALSFTPKFMEFARKMDLEKKIREGLTLLVMEQCTDSPLKKYLENRRARRLFVKDSRHPVMRDVSSDDLRHWRGNSDKLEPYPKQNLPEKDRFMHWGMEGVVSTYLFTKPEAGRFRVLIDGDADLAKCAILEFFIGSGRIIFCQLDFGGRLNRDIPASLLAQKLFAYLENPEKLSVRSAGAMLSKENLKLLETLCFPLPSAKGNEDLILADASCGIRENVFWQKLLKRGGTLILLKPSEEQLKLFNLKTKKRPFHLGKTEISQSLLRGLGNSDFYFNPILSLPVFGERTILLEKRAGKGHIIVLTVLPGDLKENASIVKAKRILSTVLTNCGVPGKDVLNFDPVRGPLLSPPPDGRIYGFDLNFWRQW